MTDPADNRPLTADHLPADPRPRTPPPFAPVFTLVNNASTRTTHHPHVRYIFSDDDPDILTRALAECEYNNNADELNSDAAPGNRAMILDMAPDDNGGYGVSWASSLSPSWAVVNAELSQISPPSSDAGHSSGSGDTGTQKNGRPDRLMLRIEGVETSAPSSLSEMRISNESGRQRPDSAGGSGSGQQERAGEGDDYTATLDEFEKRMATLRKVVSADEDRRKKIALETMGGEDMATRDTGAENPAPSS